MIRTFLSEWVLQPQYLTAWLQAAAAVVALCISVWAVWWQGADARRRNRLELRALAVAIYPEIEMLKVSIQGVRKEIISIKARYGNFVGQSVAGTLQVAAYIPTPPMIERNIDKLFILGDVAGPSCVHLVRLLLQYSDTVQMISQHIVMMNADQWTEAIDQLEQHLALLDSVIGKCEHEIRPIHDSIKG